MATKKKTDQRKDNLKKNLLANLKSREMTDAIFTERVEDYMVFYEQLNILASDLKENGTLEYDEKTGNLVPRKAVETALKVSREIGKIWQELGISEQVKQKGTYTEDDAL